jgi:hypothetical protein
MLPSTSSVTQLSPYIEAMADIYANTPRITRKQAVDNHLDAGGMNDYSELQDKTKKQVAYEQKAYEKIQAEKKSRIFAATEHYKEGDNIRALGYQFKILDDSSMDEQELKTAEQQLRRYHFIYITF